MESAKMNSGNIHILRIDPGEDVLLTVQEFLKQEKIKQAIILGGYGTLASYHIHWVTRNTIPSENKFKKAEGGTEILAMNGLVVNGDPHIHVALSNPEGAFGGHLEPGCKAYVLCEIFLLEVSGVELSRQKFPVDIPGMGKGQVSRLMFD